MMTYEEELREEHQQELDRQIMDRELDAITYSERENANLLKAVEMLERNNKTLVALINAVEWVRDIEGNFHCPWCYALKEINHFEDCKRQQALAQALDGDDEIVRCFRSRLAQVGDA